MINNASIIESIKTEKLLTINLINRAKTTEQTKRYFLKYEGAQSFAQSLLNSRHFDDLWDDLQEVRAAMYKKDDELDKNVVDAVSGNV